MHSSTTNPLPLHPEPTSLLADRDAVLDELLDDELGFDPLASRNGFISHLAMSLVAARRLGADDHDLRTMFREQTSGDFLVRRARPDWWDADTAEVARVGPAAAAAAALPGLVDAPGSQFFHAVIRLELAVDADHAGQVANAVRNWSEHRRPLGDEPSPSGDRMLEEILAELADARDAGDLDPSDQHEMAASTAFGSIVDDLDPDVDATLEQLARVAAAAHAGAANFATLHLVTGVRAIRAMAALTDGATRTSLARRGAQAVAATWLGVGGPGLADPAELDARRADAPTDWADIARRAVRNRDPHVVKLVYACRLEHDATGDPLYLWMAGRQVGAR
jgi:hypothetical protein